VNMLNFTTIFFMKFLKFYLFILLTAIQLMFVFSCSREILEDEEGLSSADISTNIITNPVIVMTREDHVTVRTRSDMLEKDNDEDALLSGNVIANIFDDFGNHTSILYSDSARLNEMTNNFEAFGHVVFISDSGLTLKTNKLNWDNRYRLVTSSDSVMFTTEDNDTLYGVGFTSDMDLSHWKILEPTGVTGKIF
jgi:LPS export ABC transporter protein LptC